MGYATSAESAASRAPSISSQIAGRSPARPAAHHVYPTAGTVFQDTRTPLRVWFYAIYLFVTTRHGVSGKELQRTLGVTYKCAYRMGMQIRKLMAKADGFEVLKGHIEADEAFVGGRRKMTEPDNKTIVLGLKERGGRMHAETIPNTKMDALRNPDPAHRRARLNRFDR